MLHDKTQGQLPSSNRILTKLLNLLYHRLLISQMEMNHCHMPLLFLEADILKSCRLDFLWIFIATELMITVNMSCLLALWITSNMLP